MCLLFGTIARKKKTLNDLMDTILKVCNKEIVPNPKLVEYPKDAQSSDVIVSAIMRRSEEICKIVCTTENSNRARKG